MKNLRFYETDAAFKAYEQGAGGDGNSVKTMIPGVSAIWEENKTYFNPHDEAKLVHTLTVNYKDINGKTIVPSETIEISYYSGVSQETILYAKHIDEYVVNDESETVSVPNDDEVDFTYTDANVFEPLTFNIESNGSFYWCSTLGNSGKTIQYKKNDEPWVNLTSKSIPYSSWVNVSAGDVIKLRGNNLYYATSYNDYNTFSGSTCKFSIAGNIMSLIDSTNFATLKTFSNDNNFRFLFAGCTGLTSAEKLILPVTTLTSYCYSQMFYGCTSLRTAPALPATNLASYCYDSMFNGCSSLITAPELPAITLVGYCYQGMFGYCTSLVTAPELPAEAISQYCYNSMFNGCTSLTTAPLLPSLEAHWACYSGMFQGCTSLVIAPELPATKLGYACYSNMFNGCTSLTTAPLIAAPSFYGAGNCCFRMFYNCINLNYVKCLSTNLYSTSCTQEWVYNVSPSGTFVKNANMSSWTRGMNGIPNGWTVEDAS